jgi:hypothetical protein
MGSIAHASGTQIESSTTTTNVDFVIASIQPSQIPSGAKLNVVDVEQQITSVSSQLLTPVQQQTGSTQQQQRKQLPSHEQQQRPETKTSTQKKVDSSADGEQVFVKQFFDDDAPPRAAVTAANKNEKTKDSKLYFASLATSAVGGSRKNGDKKGPKTATIPAEEVNVRVFIKS